MVDCLVSSLSLTDFFFLSFKKCQFLFENTFSILLPVSSCNVCDIALSVCVCVFFFLRIEEMLCLRRFMKKRPSKAEPTMLWQPLAFTCLVD